MGADIWHCRTPYRADPTQALADAQQAVFAAGDYRRPYGDFDFLDEIGFFDAAPPEQEEMLSQYGLHPLLPIVAQVGIAGLRHWLRDVRKLPALTDIEDLRALICLSTDGTASILDVGGVTGEREAGAVAPLPAAELTRLYATDEPTRAQVEANTELYSDIGRGEAVSIVAYEDGKLTEIIYIGSAYD